MYVPITIGYLTNNKITKLDLFLKLHWRAVCKIDYNNVLTPKYIYSYFNIL